VNWRVKAGIQRFCAALPFAQETVYWFMQRHFGTLRHPNNPTFIFQEGARIAKELQVLGFSMNGARVMEVGTGRALDMPLAMHLCGAASTITFDLHPYLKNCRVEETLAFIRQHRQQVQDIFLPVAEDGQLGRRLECLCKISSCRELCESASIGIRAPADATRTGLDSRSIDVHISYTVFEHIPAPVLKGILIEAGRVLAPGGVALHHIDLSDHFARDDSSLSPIHFLKYPDNQWARMAGNQYAYQNRLREPEYRRLYEEAGHEILAWKCWQDERSLAELKAGFVVSPAFQGYSAEALSTTIVTAISRPLR